MSRGRGWVVPAVLASPAALGLAAAAAYTLRGGPPGACVGPAGVCDLAYAYGWLYLPVLGRVHLSQLALAYFTLQAALAASALASPRAALRVLAATYTLGACTVPYLVYVELARIGGLCLYCTVMHACILAGLALTLTLIKRFNTTPAGGAVYQD